MSKTYLLKVPRCKHQLISFGIKFRKVSLYFSALLDEDCFSCVCFVIGLPISGRNVYVFYKDLNYQEYICDTNS